MMVDLPALDQRIAETQTSVARALEKLDTLTEEERVDFASDPFGSRRDVAGQTTFRALQELVPSTVDGPQRDGLLRWVHELIQARIAWDLVIDESNARHLADPSLPRKANGVARTFEEARQSLLEATHPVATDNALARLDILAVPVFAVRAEMRARRKEIATRLGLASPWSLATNDTSITALATRVLDATEPLAIELHRITQRSEEPGSLVAKTILASFARDAQEGWPAHLTPRWLEESFQTLAPRQPRNVPMPEALGGASFLRAAMTWGRAFRLGSTPRSLPFGLARDPYPVETWTHGTIFTLAVAGPVFGKRKLGLAARNAEKQSRMLARPLFFGLRRLAAEVLGLGEELSARVYGAPLPPMLAALGSLSGAERIDAPARLLGMVRGDRLVRGFVQRFDEDWFDNPRAGSHLAAIASGPVWTPMADDEDSGVEVLARAFEERLG